MLLRILPSFFFALSQITPSHSFTIHHKRPPTQHLTTTTTTALHETKATPPLVINPVISSIKVSKTVEVFSLVKKLQSEGIDVTSLCVGEPDFPPPPAVLTAAIRGLTNGETRYTAVTGTAALRRAIARDLQTRKNVSYSEDEILVANGAKQNVYQGIAALCGEGDDVLIPAPFWPSYPEMATLTGAASRIIETSKEDYLLRPEELRRALEDHPRAKMLILCNPSNPSGAVHSPELLAELAKVLEDYPGVFILADEIYERLVYDDATHVSFASLPGMRDRTITVNGFSKAYAMTGMRLGYSAAPKVLTDACAKIQSQITSCAGSVSQAAGVAALEDVSEEEMQQNVDLMQEKRDFVIEKLEEMGFEFSNIPQGAFYVLLNVSEYCDGGTDDTKFCVDLLNKKRLALVPGSSFGSEGTVRISYATSLQELGVAMDKLREFLSEIKK